jgi:gamma-glutamylcyclotransferase (GGCT)/AIG2-like uncharacterized protein YtfP
MLYFAYGSNLDPDLMRERCPGHSVIGRAFLPEYRLCFPRRSPLRGCGTAGIEPCAGEAVWGALYRLSQADLPALHNVEGYQPGRARSENRYDFVQCRIERSEPSASSAAAYVYVAIGDDSGALPSASYMAHILRGAAQHGLPEAYIARLRAIPTTSKA